MENKEPIRSPRWLDTVRRIPAAWRYAAAGALLGIAAPLGALVLRLAAGAESPADELARYSFFYLYALIGTSLVFALAGLYAGRRDDRLRESRDLFQQLAERDDLTRLPNDRAFRRRYRRGLEHAAAYREPVSLLVLDVDGLKAINDRFGHSCGNAALLHAARILVENKREEDLAARWGGDEFALLMPGAATFAASRVAHGILDALRERPLRYRGVAVPVSVSIGIATRQSPSPTDDLFEPADRALYESKRLGRDQYRVADA